MEYKIQLILMIYPETLIKSVDNYRFIYHFSFKLVFSVLF